MLIVATPPPAKVATSNGDLTARDALLGILAALLAANLVLDAIYDKRRAVETAPPPVEVILSNATELVIPVSADLPAALRAGCVLTMVLAPLRSASAGSHDLTEPRIDSCRRPTHRSHVTSWPAAPCWSTTR